VPKADTDRLCAKRKGGGQDLLQIEVTYKKKVINTAEYLNTQFRENQFVNVVKSHENNKPNVNSTIKTEEWS
jgi:hypothetical protein